jgi:glycosyltransferase involved in cell wall biosynthesis
MNKSLKIVAYVHGYFPNHNAGAEAMLHQILYGLAEKGHECRVITKNPGATEYEGIPILDSANPDVRDNFEWADIIITHLNYTSKAVQMSQRYKKPIVHLVHNDKQLSYNKINSRSADLAIANSNWIKRTVPFNIPSVILYPPTDPTRYKVETTREAITLINMNEAKGGKIFWQLARIFPERKFIGVMGAYGEQIGYPEDLPNVTLYDNSPDVLKVYGKSRIVLMPSSYESWGRVALEACCSGIPVIASPTIGLKESLAYAGIFAQHDDVAAYVEAIKSLDDKELYDEFSKAGIKRSKEVSDAYYDQLDVVEQEFYRIIK